MSLNTFNWWVWRLSQPGFEMGHFVPVVMSDAAVPAMSALVCPAAGATAGRIEIVLPDGVVVRLGADVTGGALCLVLRALGR